MEYELMRAAQFIEDNWSLFQQMCEENGDDPDEILRVLQDQ